MANDTVQGKILNFVTNNLTGSVIVIAVLLLFIPLPQPLIDFLMIVNFALAIIILLIVINSKRPANFLTFPRVTEFVTLFGLGINIASTRLILTGAPKLSRGGAIKGQSLMVQGFANIVAGNELIIGVVIFILLIVVQILVFTKGATRVAEVQARFQLDAMNGKRFEIDSQLQAGEITSEEAKRLKEELSQEIDFYSNMDGSSKFVSGNAKFGIIVTAVNFLAGLGIGILKNHLSASDCLNIYSRLTIGDGLISQVPSLILSFATAVLITGNKSDSTLNDQLKHDFMVSGTIYAIAGGFLILIGLGIAIPNKSFGLFFLLALLGGLLIFSGTRMNTAEKASFAKKLAEENERKAQTQTGANPEEVKAIKPLDSMSLELGYGLLPLVDKDKGTELLGRVKSIREETAIELGLIVPKIRIQDNMQLAPNEYAIKIRGNEIARYEVKPSQYLCMNFGSVVEEVKGDATVDPCYGVPSVWVSEDMRNIAEQNGYAVFDSSTVIATHLTEVIRNNAAELLRRKEVSELIERARENNAPVVEDIVKSGLTNGEIQKVLQNLLRERVSIRDIEAILETLSNFGDKTKDVWFLTEKVREELGVQICTQYLDPGSKKLSVVQLSQEASVYLLDHQVVPSDGASPYVAFSPEDGRKWIDAVSGTIAQIRQLQMLPIILCAAEVRRLVKTAIEREMPDVVVLSINEVVKAGNKVELESLGVINVDW